MFHTLDFEIMSKKFSLHRHFTEFTPAKTLEYLIVISQLANPACCFEYLKGEAHRLLFNVKNMCADTCDSF